MAAWWCWSSSAVEARLDWRRLSYASISITALWIVVALVARRDTCRRSVPASAPDRYVEAIRDVGDAADRGLVEELSSEDETPCSTPSTFWKRWKPNLITPLLPRRAPRAARVLRAFSPTISWGGALATGSQAARRRGRGRARRRAATWRRWHTRFWPP
jgi:hypothetical protein